MNARKFGSFVVMCVVVGIAAQVGAQPQAPEESHGAHALRPNILFILTEDQDAHLSYLGTGIADAGYGCLGPIGCLLSKRVCCLPRLLTL